MKPLQQLIEAQNKAQRLFSLIEQKHLIQANKTEKELNEEILELASSFLQVKKFWHKRIVRSGANTLFPYKENPPNNLITDNDILFIDLGPVFEEWEADFGRTFVIGDDPFKNKLKKDVELAWQEAITYYKSKPEQTGAEYFNYISQLSKKYGWQYGGPYAGHLVGKFPHEKLQGEDMTNYIHPENNIPMNAFDKNGNERFWILEIHFIDIEKQIGGFFEQLIL